MSTMDADVEALVYARGPDTPLREVGVALLDQGLVKHVEIHEAFSLWSDEGRPRGSAMGRAMMVWAKAGQAPAVVKAIRAVTDTYADAWCVAMPVMAGAD